jgi:hypothetical protein
VSDNGFTPDAAGVCFRRNRDNYLLEVNGVARYLVRGGSSVTVDSMPGADGASVLAFLSTPVFVAVLAQRDILAVCGTTIATSMGAILLLGPPASGKSTVAALLAQRGYPVVSDGLCAMAEECSVWPGMASMQLWRDSLDLLGISCADLLRVRAGMPKYRLPFAPALNDGPMAIHRAYYFETGYQPDFSLRELRGFERLGILVDSSASYHYLGGHAFSEAQVALVCSLASTARVFEVPNVGHRSCAEVAALIEQDL